MTQPPLEMVKIAVLYARESPCAKSKRGVVAWTEGSDDVAVGFNGPPAPFTCAGTPACRTTCGTRCNHAEARTLIAMATRIGAASILIYAYLIVTWLGEEWR